MIKPIEKVFIKLEEMGLPVAQWEALELFGGKGILHTMDYINLIGQLDVWDIHPEHEAILKKNLPGANIEIVDNRQELKITDKKYDVAICDNGMGTEDKQEHFLIFDDMVGVLKDKAVMIINVVPEKTKLSQTRMATNFNAKHIKARQDFYGLENVENISSKMMGVIYHYKLHELGYILTDAFFECRGGYVWYMVLVVSKTRED